MFPENLLKPGLYPDWLTFQTGFLYLQGEHLLVV